MSEEVKRLQEALEALGRERNTWAKQLAEARAEAESSKAETENMHLEFRSVLSERDAYSANYEALVEGLEQVIAKFSHGEVQTTLLKSLLREHIVVVVPENEKYARERVEGP